MKKPFAVRCSIAISVALVFIHFFSCSRSKDNKDSRNIAECYSFADQHWIEDDYRDWLMDSLGITSGSDQDSFWNKEEQRFDWLSHHLPNKKDQQYYEMIGKYDQFKYGWDDFPEEDLEQKHRNEYLECLNRVAKSNKSSPTRPE